MPDGRFVQQVVEAFRVSTSDLALSRSPLAQGRLIEPALVLDDTSPTADDRGEALRFALAWAVEQLAPAAPEYAYGQERPLDDPTLREPAWWSYNVLRHRYLETYHPGAYVEAELYSETLIAVMGMPSADSYFEARERGLGDAARWLWKQMQEGIADARIRALALEAVDAALADQPGARALLGIASVFSGVFPVRTLHALAFEENVRYPERAQEVLVSHRIILSGDGGTTLWISRPLREHIAAQQATERQARRHWLAARLAREEGRPFAAVYHMVEARQWQPAAQSLLEMGSAQREEYGAELVRIIERMELDDLPAAQRLDLCLLLAERRLADGDSTAAAVASEMALRSAITPAEQARVLLTLGKALEQDDSDAAVECYRSALGKLPTGSSERLRVHLALAWIAIGGHDWGVAEAELDNALTLSRGADPESRAEVHEALSSLYRWQERFVEAVQQAQQACGLLDQSGDRMRLGKSYNTLGILRRLTGDYAEAIVAYQSALEIFERMGNRVLEATALLNLGTAFHFDDHIDDAVRCYQRCLLLTDERDMPHTEVRAHANLCEALMHQSRVLESQAHCRIAWEISRRLGLEDEVAFLRELGERYSALLEVLGPGGAGDREPGLTSMGELAFDKAPWSVGQTVVSDPDEAMALALAESSGQIRASGLVSAAHISKATATRKLTRLADAGLLTRHGQGRSTYYTRTLAVPAESIADDIAGLQARLDALLLRLQPRYGVTSLEALASVQVVDSHGVLEHGFDVKAHYAAQPLMSAFLELQKELGSSMGLRIRLLPS